MKNLNNVPKITLLQYLYAKILQKISGACVKFHLPRFFREKIYKVFVNHINFLLRPYFHNALKDLTYGKTFKGSNGNKNIWMFWWQGYNNMPLIVKQCIESVKRNSGGHNVVLLTRRNIKAYVDFHNILFKKVSDKKISLAHFSDIVRFYLLTNYGGLWIDSTIYCTSKITNRYFNYLYTTGGYIGTPPKFVKGRWAEFLIGGNRYNAALQFENNFLQSYYCKNNYVLNYFLADYGLNYAYNHNIGRYKDYVDNVACHNNPNLFKLVGLLNKPYNQAKFASIMSQTNMFKLTYKMKFNDFGNTFYNFLINKN